MSFTKGAVVCAMETQKKGSKSNLGGGQRQASLHKDYLSG